MTAELQSILPVSPKPIGGTPMNAVNARDLHLFLEVKTRFNDWIRIRVQEFEFQEHRDFEVYSNSSNAFNQQLTPAKEYALSLDMAKELAMVERNDRGKQARAYFLECERRANDPVQALLAMSRADTLALAAQLAREKEALKAQVIEMEPKVAFCNAVASIEDGITVEAFAKVLGTGRNRMFEWLRQERFLMPGNLPYQRFLNEGIFRVIEKTWRDSSGEVHPRMQTLVTGKGQVYLEAKYRGSSRIATIQ